jgi:hypothetical protein
MVRVTSVCLLSLLLLLAACAAPAPESATAVTARSDATAPAEQSSATTPPPTATPDEAQADQPKRNRPKPPPLRTGGPLPPERVGDRKPDPNATPVEINDSCRTDADCTVKNVGNCCGYYPACVNVNSPTDPEGVQRQCAKSGMASVCGWADISSCSCVQGRCQGNTSGAVEQ